MCKGNECKCPGPWTDQQRAYLIEHYGHKPTKEIAAELGRTVLAIHHQVSKMGISKPRHKPAHLDVRGWVDWTHHEAIRARRRRGHLYCRGCGKVPQPDERWQKWCLDCWPHSRRRNAKRESAA